ncbi:MAG: hypothetical protein JXB17_12190, partial [Bacteroidales bacterium]|nr:hypothetical protein [Bacteroidales bacterium]
MKKNIVILLTLIATISFSATMLADAPDIADEPSYTARKTTVAPAIDAAGNDAIWTASSTASSLGFNRQDNLPGASDISFTWKAAWDDEKLYLLITVTDDVVFKRHTDYQPDEVEAWMGDNIEIFFNPTGERQPDGEDTYALTMASQHRLIVGQESEEYEITCDQSYIYLVLNETYGYEIDYPGNGYVAEIWYTWDAILPNEMEFPNPWGFTINVGDADDITTKRDVIAMWAGAGLSDQQWLSVNYFGLLNLDGELPPPPPPPPAIQYYSDISLLVNNDGIVTAAPSLLNFGDVKVGR